MWQAIAAAIGLVTDVNAKSSAQYMMDKQQQQSAVDFSRQKDMIVFSDASKQGFVLVLILLALVVITVIVIRQGS